MCDGVHRTKTPRRNSCIWKSCAAHGAVLHVSGAGFRERRELTSYRYIIVVGLGVYGWGYRIGNGIPIAIDGETPGGKSSGSVRQVNGAAMTPQNAVQRCILGDNSTLAGEAMVGTRTRAESGGVPRQASSPVPQPPIEALVFICVCCHFVITVAECANPILHQPL